MDGIDSATPSPDRIDMARLLGRTPKFDFHDKTSKSTAHSVLFSMAEDREPVQQLHSGSGLGAEWDDRVGAGASAASIVSQLAGRLYVFQRIGFVHSFVFQ